MKRTILVMTGMLLTSSAWSFSKCQIGFTTLYKDGPCPVGTEVPVEGYGGFSALDMGGLSLKIKVDEMARRAEEGKRLRKELEERARAEEAAKIKAVDKAKKTLTGEAHQHEIQEHLR